MVIDAHAHVSWPPDPAADRAQIEGGDLLGIEVFVCSCLALRPSNPDTFRAANDRLIAAMQEFPGRIWGYCYVNPGFGAEALAEIDRCLHVEDMLGVKLYNEYFFNEPVLRPLVEHCIKRDIPILEHQGHCTDPIDGQPRISDAGHLSQMAREYPEAKIILGHICGGGDWEWTIKQTATAPSLYADTSGSVVDEGAIELAVREIGADRLLFACDGSLSAGVGKVRGAQLSDEDKRKIWGENFQRLVGRA